MTRAFWDPIIKRQPFFMSYFLEPLVGFLDWEKCNENTSRRQVPPQFYSILSNFYKTLQKHRRIFLLLIFEKIRGKDMISILISKCKLWQGSARS